MGEDPSAARQAKRLELAVSFEGVATEWLALQAQTLAPGTISMLTSRLNSCLNPYIGSRPIASLTAQELLFALRRIEARGCRETAHRARAVAGRVLRYAVATGRAQHDVAADLREALAPVKSKNFASVKDPKQLGQLLRAIDGYRGHPVTALALKLAPLVFVRPGELRGAEWSEFDWAAAEWRIPAKRMKMGQLHVVPLARQALAILSELQPLARGGPLVFPSLRSRYRPMSDNTINAALRRLGYSSEEQTCHGFRSTASTLLNEQGFPADVIELQLAHAERNKVRAAYNKAQRLAERRSMMQQWADYLVRLKEGAVIEWERPPTQQMRTPRFRAALSVRAVFHLRPPQGRRWSAPLTSALLELLDSIRPFGARNNRGPEAVPPRAVVLAEPRRAALIEESCRFLGFLAPSRAAYGTCSRTMILSWPLSKWGIVTTL